MLSTSTTGSAHTELLEAAQYDGVDAPIKLRHVPSECGGDAQGEAPDPGRCHAAISEPLIEDCTDGYTLHLRPRILGLDNDSAGGGSNDNP